MDAETITAISRLWPLALILFLAVCVILFRAQIASLLDRADTFRLKRGTLEAELSASTVAKSETAATVTHPQTIALEEAPTLEEQLDLAETEPASAGQWAERMVAAFRDGDLEAAQMAFAETQEAEDDPVKKLQYKALYAFCRSEEGDPSALHELQQLAEQGDVAPMAYPLLGRCYEDVGDFKHAAKSYEMAAQHADSEEDRAQMVVHAANCLFKDGKQQDAYTLVMMEISALTGSDALSSLYEGLASLYEHAKEPALRALALDKALEFKPNDFRLRFGAAYSYGQNDLVQLALLHYKTLVGFDPDEPSSVNNLGVAYALLDMPIRAVESYEAAAAGNETLAAANLAEAYITAGFKREAQEVIDQARKQQHVHARVGAAMQEISEREEAEANTEQLILEAAREQHRFLLSFAGAYFTGQVAAPTFAGTWKLSDGADAVIRQTDNDIEANWDRENKKYRFTGQVNNRGATITTYKMEYGVASGKELGFTEDKTGYAYLSPDDQELLIMTIKGHEHSVETLTRSEDDF